MDIVFLDTNALIKLHLPEIGSAWLKNFIITKQITISELALIEAITILRRLYTEGLYTKPEAINLIAQIQEDCTTFDTIPFNGKTFQKRLSDVVFSLNTAIRVRALDAIHLTTATIITENLQTLTPVPTFTFVCSDRQLIRAAQAIGLIVENPENHP